VCDEVYEVIHAVGARQFWDEIKEWRGEDLKSELFSSELNLRDRVTYTPKIQKLDPSFLVQKYVDEGLSLAQIARLTSSSKSSVREALVRCGTPIRKPHLAHSNPAQPRFGTKRRKDMLEKHVAEQRVIRAILHMRKGGMSLRAIVRSLAELKLPTKRRGKSWHPEMINRILKSGKMLET
jgi:hypothetical protein